MLSSCNGTYLPFSPSVASTACATGDAVHKTVQLLLYLNRRSFTINSQVGAHLDSPDQADPLVGAIALLTIIFPLLPQNA